MKRFLNLRYLVPLLAFVVIAGFLLVGLTLNPTYLPSTLINKPAPPFSLPLLYKTGNTMDNQPAAQFSPKTMHGKRWLLNVWASWCVSCRYEHPLLNELASNTRIPLIGLNYKDEPDNAKQWLQERGNPYTMVPVDYAGDAGIEWGVYGVPETFVIDEAGLVIYKHAGPITAEIVNREILPLFN